MQLQRRAVVHFGLRKFAPYCEYFTWQIVFRVGGAEQNSRHNRNLLRSGSDIGPDRLIDRGAGELEEAIVNSSPPSALLDKLDETLKFTDSFRIATPVPGYHNVVV